MRNKCLVGSCFGTVSISVFVKYLSSGFSICRWFLSESDIAEGGFLIILLPSTCNWHPSVILYLLSHLFIYGSMEHGCCLIIYKLSWLDSQSPVALDLASGSTLKLASVFLNMASGSFFLFKKFLWKKKN